MNATASSGRTITVSVDGTNKSAALPVMSGTVGPEVVDIRKL